MSKRILSLVLAMVMVLGSFSFTFAAEDTTTVEVAETVDEKVQWLVDHEYVVGDSGGLRLEDNIRRAEVAVIVAKALGLEDVADAAKLVQGQFTDVTPYGDFNWANGYINALSGKGVLNGYTDGTIRPANNISLQEVATMMVMAYDEEAPAGTWPMNMIVRASELGLFDDIDTTAYAANATRQDTFVLIYNAINNLQLGDHDVVKAIVLENYRVEKLDENEIVIEVLEEVQRSNYADESRDIEGAQYNVVIPEAFDVEELLGKVANFTFSGVVRDGKEVLEVVVDESYKVVEGSITDATRREIEIDWSDDYTVELPERYDSEEGRDERIFRTYLNNDAYSYENFYEDEETAEYARVTVKNGKVLFIDAFNFDDIAPVAEVDEDAIYVLDDEAGADEKEIELDDIDYVIDLEDGKFSLGEKEEIAENDVVHYFDETFIVRKDAEIEGVYDKVRREGSARNIYLEDHDDAYEVVLDEDDRRAVYTHDYEDYEVLDSVSPLDDFKDEEVVILIDMFDNVQFIGAEVPESTYYALINDTLSRSVELALEDGTTADYDLTFDSYLEDEDGNEVLLREYDDEFTEGNLVLVEVDNEKEEIVSMVELDVDGGYKVNKINKDEVEFDDEGDYRFVRDTIIFIDNGDVRKAVTLDDLLDDYEIWDEDTVDKYDAIDTLRISLNEEEDVIILNAEESDPSDTVYAKVDGIDREGTTRDVDVFEDGKDAEITNYPVRRNSDAWKNIEDLGVNDVVKLTVTDEDEPKLIKFEILIDASEDPVYKVARYDEKVNELTLEDKDGDKETFDVSNYAKIFGDEDLDRNDHVQIAYDDNGKYVRYISITRASVNADFEADEETGVVTYINETRLFVDDERYTLDADTVLLAADEETILAVGGADIIDPAKGNLLVDDIVDVTEVKNGVVVEVVLIERAAEAAQNLQDAIDAANIALATVETAQTAYTTAGGLATDEVYTAVTDAEEALEAAVEAEVTADIVAVTEDLEDAVEALNDATEELANQEPEKTALELATEAVEKAEDSLLQADIDEAQALVSALPSGADRVALQTRLNGLTAVTVTGVEATGEVTTVGVDYKAAVPAVSEVKASLALGNITIESVLPGTDGNDITVEVIQGTDARQELEVSVDGHDITITLPADALGNPVDVTEAELVVAINANASALVNATTTDDTATVSIATKALLTGGVDEAAEIPEVTAVAEVYTLTITNGATANGTITVKGADVDVDVNVIAGMTAEMVAEAIENSALAATGYTITVDENKVIFTADTAEAKATSLDITVVDK